MLHQGHSQRSVARHLGVSASTISRELARARTLSDFRYLAFLGKRVGLLRRARASLARRKLGPDLRSPCWRFIRASLHQGWSPEQIAGRLKSMNSGPVSAAASIPSVSHETIYCAIYAQPRGTLRTELVKLLRKSHSGRLPRARGTARFTGLQDMTSIDLRPPEVAARIVPGHWEGDLIKGARNRSAVGTIVERTSRFVMLVKLDSAHSGNVLEGFTRRLRSVPQSLRKTLTYDQGTEMALHQTLAKRLRMERRNALLRQALCRPPVRWRSAHRSLVAASATRSHEHPRLMARDRERSLFVQAAVRSARAGCPSAGGQRTSRAKPPTTAGADSRCGALSPRTLRRAPLAYPDRLALSLTIRPSTACLTGAFERTCPGVPEPAAQGQR